jgi:hypothetical protein
MAETMESALLQFAQPPENMTEQERGLLEYHRNNLRNKTYLEDDQGLTTLYMTGVTGPDGRIYNVPGYFDGARQPEEAARKRAESVGWGNYPSYATGPESNAAAQKFHGIVDEDMGMFNALSGNR